MKGHSIFIGISIMLSAIIIGGSIVFAALQSKFQSNDYNRYYFSSNSEGVIKFIADKKTKRIYSVFGKSFLSFNVFDKGEK